MKTKTLWLKDAGLSLACGVLASLPLVLDTIPLLSFFLYIPYFLYLMAVIRERSLRSLYLSGLFFYLGYYAGAFCFFSAMYPLDFAGLGVLGSVAVLFAAMLLLPLFQASFAAFSVVLLGVFAKRRWLPFPLAFSLASAALFTLFATAQNLTWAGVPWASPAVGIASAPILIQSASLLGSAFLCFLIFFVNAALAESFVLLRGCRDKAALLAFFCALCLFSVNLLSGGLLLTRKDTSERTLTVAVIQGNAPSTEHSFLGTRLRRAMIEAREAAEKADVDLMLWSESFVQYDLLGDALLCEEFAALAKETGAMQVVGAFCKTDEGFYNALYLFTPDGEMSEERYFKRRPVPFGEYVPWRAVFETLIPPLTEISILGRDIDAGDAPQVFHTEAGTLGGLICFDSIYPTLARTSTKAGAELLLLSTDDSWFDGSYAKSLHLRHAVLRAVENGRSVVRTGNTGISAVIDREGHLLAETLPDECTHAVATVSLHESGTPYTVMGEVFVALCIAFLFALPVGVTLRGRKKQSSDSIK